MGIIQCYDFRWLFSEQSKQHECMQRYSFHLSQSFHFPINNWLWNTFQTSIPDLMIEKVSIHYWETPATVRLNIYINKAEENTVIVNSACCTCHLSCNTTACHACMLYPIQFHLSKTVNTNDAFGVFSKAKEKCLKWCKKKNQIFLSFCVVEDK